MPPKQHFLTAPKGIYMLIEMPYNRPATADRATHMLVTLSAVLMGFVLSPIALPFLGACAALAWLQTTWKVFRLRRLCAQSIALQRTYGQYTVQGLQTYLRELEAIQRTYLAGRFETQQEAEIAWRVARITIEELSAQAEATATQLEAHVLAILTQGG
jgi:hypothetical protein